MSLKVIQNGARWNIAIAAGKGGVGKSTLSVLLAGALKKQGERVGLLDADLYGPSIRQMLPEERLPVEKEGKWLPAYSHGIQTLSYAYFSSGAAMRAPMANQILKQLFQNTFWEGLDTLLIDFPPGTGDIPLSIAQMIPLQGALLVTTPQRVATLDVEKTLSMFRKLSVPILGIVENMSYFKEESCTPFGKGGAEALAQKEGIPFLGKIPIEPAISERGDEGSLASLELPVIQNIILNLKTRPAHEGTPLQKLSFTSPKTLKLEWREKKVSLLSAEGLQKKCPCAQCRSQGQPDPEVAFQGWERVGHYGLRFSFSSGCSSGIFSFEFLQRLSDVQ